MIDGSVAIIGPGRMGLTLAAALLRSEEVDGVTLYGRHPDAPPHPLFGHKAARYVYGLDALAPDTKVVLLAVPDAAVPSMAQSLASHGPAPERCAAFHLSGALPTDVLEPLHHRGYQVGSFHPMLAVADPRRGVDQVQGAFFAVTGAPETVAAARRLASAMGAELLTVPSSRKPLYDAAVVMASSYLLPLLGRSATLMQRAGVDGDDAIRALLPLVRATLTSVEDGGLPESAQGPIARGDVEAVALHLRALDPDDQRLYALLGVEILKWSEGRLAPETHQAMAELFGRYVELAPSGTGF